MKKILFAVFVLVLGLMLSGCAAGFMEMVKANTAGDMATVDKLLADKPDLLTEENYRGQTVLMYAASKGDLKLAKLVLKKGASVNLQSKDNGSTALMWAAQDSSVEMVEFLLKAKADVKVINSNGQNAVHWACNYGNIKTLEVLLKYGGDARVSDSQQRTPIMVAAYGGNPECVQLLMKKGFYTDGLVFTNLIKDIIIADKKKTVKFIIKAGYAEDALNRVDFMGKSPLTWAVITGNTEMVKALLDAGADVNSMDTLWNSSVMWAVIESKTPALKELLYRGANLDTQDKANGKTPLMTSIMGGNMDAFREIMKYRNNFDIFNNGGVTALGLARDYNNKEAYNTLWNAGARMTEKPKAIPTPLPKKYDEHKFKPGEKKYK